MRSFSKSRTTRTVRMALIACGALATSCSSAFAKGDETWRCDTPYGKFDQNTLSIPATSQTLSGQILFHSGDKGEVYNPTAHIALTDDSTPPTDGDCYCDGIRATMYRNLPGIVTYEMIYGGKSEGFAQANVGEAITFKISVDNNAVMTVQIGTAPAVVKTAQLNYIRHNMVHMSCSGGDVSFLNVQAS